MADPSVMEMICNSGTLYTEEFIQHFGKKSPHWSSSTWPQREASLRHDMVCILLCNLQPVKRFADEDCDFWLERPAIKRSRTQSGSTASTSTGQSDVVMEDADAGEYNDQIASMPNPEALLRYIVLEGKSNIAQYQNMLSTKYHLPSMKKQYDIFDRVEKKFIEVKVTLNYTKSLLEYELKEDPKERTALVHMNPSSYKLTMVGKEDPMPGAAKAEEFLLKRAVRLAAYPSVVDSDLFVSESLIEEVFCNSRFNKSVAEWSNLFWDYKNKEPSSDENQMEMAALITLSEHRLKELIEDTSKRDAPFMTLPLKVLPRPIVREAETSLNLDGEMLDFIMKGLTFREDSEKAKIANWLVKRWSLGEKKTFCFTVNRERKIIPDLVQKDLGMGCKGTVRSDDHENLRQKEFGPIPKARYSAWMDHLMKYLSKPNGTGINYFEDLQNSENADEHPMAVLSDTAVSSYFKLFGNSNLGAYCNKVKGVYSRFGGAYAGRGGSGKGKPETVIFPIYAVGNRNGETVRSVSGFIVRGAHHARTATDRIPFIIIEMLDSVEGLKYWPFVRNMHILHDTHGNAWSYRVNSIAKGSTSFLSFMANSAYLPANMLGELTINIPNPANNLDAGNEVINFLNSYPEWFMDRCCESVMMAVLGSSQEEGAMAIIRKIYMLKLAWSRGEKPLGYDLPGLADALNECLINSPFALYMGKKIRDTLASFVPQ